MNKIWLILIFVAFLLGCQTQQETTSGVRYPEPPDKPKRMPSYPAVVENIPLPGKTEKENDSDQKGKEDQTRERPGNESKGEREGKTPDRRRLDDFH